MEFGGRGVGGGLGKGRGEDHSSTDAELKALVECMEVAPPHIHFIMDLMVAVPGVKAGKGVQNQPN